MLRQVTTQYGEIRGVASGDPRVTVFKGVPFAKPPIGELRWRSPEKPEPWEGVLQADRFPDMAWQNAPGQHPDTDFYIMSVNPIDEEFLLESETAVEEVLDTINNLNIAKLNIALKEEFASRYLDCAAWLKENGFDTVDGLHFSTSTYLKVHDFAVNELF